MDNTLMAQPEKLPKKDFVTKEIFIMLTPLVASYLWTIFYEAGYAGYFGIPFSFINLDIVDILLTNRLTLLAATIAFLWIGLYYNILPSVSSAIFKGLITVLLIVAISLGSLFGWTAASRQVEFLVANTVPEAVVLQIYGETMITAPFERHVKTVRQSFTIRKIGANENLSLTLEEVGPLTPAVVRR